MARRGSLPVLLALLALFAGHVQSYTIHHRVLLLSKPGITNTDFLETTLQGYGVPYDIVRIDATNVASLSTTEFWYNADGSAKYSGITMTPSFEGDGTMNRAQVTAMWAYMTKNNVRMVQVGAWPGSYGYNVGTRPDGNLACSAGAADATFAANLVPGNFTVSGINQNATLPMAGLYRCAGTTPTGYCAIWASDFGNGLGGPCTVAPVLQVPAETVAGPKGTTAWTVNTFDGRELLVATYDCAAWSPTCLVFGHFALAWLTKGLIPGYRRATLNTQVDDFFLSTDTTHLKGLRLTTTDLINHRDWHANISAYMPAGSSYKSELAFNGFGILEPLGGDIIDNFDINNEDCADNTTYALNNCTCYLMDYNAGTCTSPNAFCQTCMKNYPKPLGSGTTQLIDTFANYASGWDKAAMIASDQLFAAIHNNTYNLAESFYYCHHTFTHMNFDNATIKDVTLQIQLNQQMAGPNYLNFSGGARSTWSENTMVTPQISGLANGDALKALFDTGIKAVIGDNTFSYLLNKEKPYQLKYTTLASSNYAGYPIIPRYATEIYYNTSTAAENLALYKKVYPTLTTKTFKDILDREAARIVPSGLLQLRHDAHMFHQANLNTNLTGLTGIFGQPASLLMAWVERIVTEHKKYTTWPLISLKADDLYKLFKDREARDNCAFDYKMTIDDTTGALQSLSVGSLSTCAKAAPVMVPNGAALSGATMEQLGSEPATFWAAANGNASAVTGSFVWGPLMAPQAA